MEDRNDQNLHEGSVSDALFGTSSDAIIEGLHQGVLTAQSFNGATEEDTGRADDKNQIVNEQDQNEITNALVNDEFSSSTSNQASQSVAGNNQPMSKSEAQAILSENNHLDEAGDTESSVIPANSEKDKIN